MARRSVADLSDAVAKLLGENATSDEAITLLEDIADSVKEVDVSEYESRIKDLEKEVKDTDENWRMRYTQRFHNRDDKEEPFVDSEEEKKDEELKDVLEGVI